MYRPFDQNKIEAYLMGKLKPNERIAFEEHLEQDPILQSEFQLQGEILKAIQSQRKHELKARLDQLSVQTNPIFSVSRALFFLGTVLLIGASSSWMYFNWNTQTQQSSENRTGLPVVEPEKGTLLPLPTRETLPKEEGLASEETPLEKENIIAEKVSSISPQKNRTEQGQVYQPKTKKQVTNPKPVIIERNINDPKMPNIKAGTIRTAYKTDLVLKETEEEELVKGIFDGSNEPNLEDIAQKNQNRLRYQYYNNELFLYNSSSAGRTFRIKQRGEERLYLYYNENYYLLHEPQIQSKELKPIQDISLIQQLDVIRIQLYGK